MQAGLSGREVEDAASRFFHGTTEPVSRRPGVRERKSQVPATGTRSLVDGPRSRSELRQVAMFRGPDADLPGIHDEAGLRIWLDRKAAQGGFAVTECVVGPPQASYFVNKRRKRGKHNSVDFQGLLRVTDRAAFQSAFHEGIGPAKAFGFGLLLLEPVATGSRRRERD